MADAGPPSLVILPGALGPIEDVHSFAAILGEHRRLVPITYSADDSLNRLLDRVASEGASVIDQPFDILGQSYGGWIAQCFAGRFPGQVRRLAISHSFALSPRDAWRFRLGGRLLQAMPAGLFYWMLGKRIALALKSLNRLDQRLCDRLSNRLAAQPDGQSLRSILLAQQRVLAESCAAVGRPLDVPMLIIESDDDPIISASAQAALKARYPQAEVHRFSGTGHVSALAKPREYALAVDRFLA